MRVLSISRPLSNRAVDNHTIFNAPAAFDYDAVAIDPQGVFESIREVVEGGRAHETHSGSPITRGSLGLGVPLADVLRRRREEFTRLLDRGGLVAVVLRPQATLDDVLDHGELLDRYFFLPAPAGLAWDRSLIRWGEGDTAAVSDHGHPFAPFLDEVHDAVQYRAHFDEHAPGFAEHARIFARSRGGAPIGVEVPVLSGRVVFLPAVRIASVEARMAQGSAFVNCARELLGRLDDDRAPRWLDQQAVPGLAEREDDLGAASERLRSAEGEVAEVARAAEKLARVRDVLWRRGRFGLLPAAAHCLELLGFRVAGLDEDVPTLHAPGAPVLTLEVEGADGAVDMTPHYRLRARLDAALAKDGRAARGLVVVNGDRLRVPESRDQQFEDTLRVGAESTRYALITATELFAAARAALAGADDSTLGGIRTRLAETDGLVSLADLLGEGAEAPPANEE